MRKAQPIMECILAHPGKTIIDLVSLYSLVESDGKWVKACQKR